MESTTETTVPDLARFLLANLDFQRKNGYIYSAWGYVRIIEHHILIELDTARHTRPSDLAIRLNHPPAQLAHVLASMKEQGLVREVEGDTEREKILLLTKEGRKLSRMLDDVSNQLMNLLAQNLNYDEQRKFNEFWETLNNGLHAPRTIARPGDHPLRLQTRRFTRIFGYFARRPGESQFGFPELHFLYRLQLSPQGETLSSLADKFRISAPNLKKLAMKLHEQGLCSKPSEKEGACLVLTPEGAQAFTLAIKSLANTLNRSLAPPVAEKLEQLTPYFSSAIEKWEPAYEIDPSPSLHSGYFLELQIQVLEEYSRSFYGVLTDRPVNPAENSHCLVIFDGPTPCFSLRCSRSAPFTFLECGFSYRTDWESVSRLLEIVFLDPQQYLHPSQSVTILPLNLAEQAAGTDAGAKVECVLTIPTEPLRTLLKFTRGNLFFVER